MKKVLQKYLAGALAALMCFGASLFVACGNDNAASSSVSQESSSVSQESSSTSQDSSSSAGQDLPSAGKDSSSAEQDSSSTETGTEQVIRLKVGSYNIAHGLCYDANGSNAEVNLGKTARALKDLGLEIVGLNEVYDKGSDDRYSNQTFKLALFFGTTKYVFGEAYQFDWGGGVAIGNSVLSKYEIVDSQYYFVPAPTEAERRPNENAWYEDRIIVKTTIDVGREICFITTHFGLNGLEQERMAAKLVEVLDAETRPIILCGDFNASPDSKVLQPIYARLQSAADVTDKRYKPTIASWNPYATIDYIFVSEAFTVKDFDVASVVLSDHLPLWADLELVI